MTVAAVGVAWLLVSLDLALMGYRVAWGTSALLDNRRRHRRAALGLAAAGQPAVLATVAAATALHGRDPGMAAAVEDALERLLWISIPYALLIGAASLALLVRSVDIRSTASVVVFGPLTLIRPVVVLAATVGAVAPDALDHPPLLALASAGATGGVGLEVVLNRRAAARLLGQRG